MYQSIPSAVMSAGGGSMLVVREVEQEATDVERVAVGGDPRLLVRSEDNDVATDDTDEVPYALVWLDSRGQLAVVPSRRAYLHRVA